jgi:hypothetical protein
MKWVGYGALLALSARQGEASAPVPQTVTVQVSAGAR